MQPVYQTALRSWSIPPVASFALLLTALIYLRGWANLRRAGSADIPPWRAITFLVGLFTLWVALASPFDTFSGFLVTAHMLQHMLLMMVSPPLILLGEPLIPIVRGLPRFAAREFAGPFLNWRVANRIGLALTHPVFALVLMGLAMFAWHTPKLYELALGSSAWHEVEHACFFISSLIFWWPVVQPWPSRERWPRWAMVPYLLIGDLQNTVLSAILVFSDRVLYPSYTVVPRLFGLSAQDDQAAAGAIMWVVGSLAYVIPAVMIAIQCLSIRRAPQFSMPHKRRRTALEASSGSQPSLSRFAAFLRAQGQSRTAEMISFVVAFLVIGLCLSFLVATSSDDDNQVVRQRQQSGAFDVTVFAAPGDLPMGASNFSILAQDRSTGEVLLDTSIELSAQPSHDGHTAQGVSVASSEDSENKLLQAAEVNFPTEGDWLLNVHLQRKSESADVSLPVRAVPRESDVADLWPYSLWPALGAILFGIYMWRHREARRVSPLKQHVSSP